MLNRIASILFKPYLVALILTAGVYVLSPFEIDKYLVEPVGSDYHYESKIVFHDLDQDGITELVKLYFDGNGPGKEKYNAPALLIMRDFSPVKGHKILDQFNLDMPWFLYQKIGFGNYDGDKSNEIYFYSHRNDSLFLTGIDVLKEEWRFLERFITTFNFDRGFPDINPISSIQLYDITGDGYKEVFGSINGGYSGAPRFIYYYDIQNDELKRSNCEHAYFNFNDVFYDNSLGYVLTTSSGAPGNVVSADLFQGQYTDTNSYLMIFDEDFNFLFDPVWNPGQTSSVISKLDTTEDKSYLYSLFSAPRGTANSVLRKYDLAGTLLAEIDLSDSCDHAICRVQDDNSSYLLLNKYQNKTFEVIGKNLHLSDIMDIEFSNFLFKDLDHDGIDEVINWNKSGTTAQIYRKGIRHPAKIPLASDVPEIMVQSCILSDNSANFIIKTGHNIHFYNYYPNSLYYVMIAFYIIIYLFLLMVMKGLLYVQKQRLTRRFEQEKKLTELELVTIKNQIDPHFIFNALSSISSIIFKEEKKTAYQYLADFSSMIRTSLTNSKEISIPLEEELNFIQNYLKLERFRFNNKFEYNIEVQADIDLSVQIPKMIIQTFVENAVKHGIMHKEKGGRIDVLVSKDSEKLLIDICDNGIGRASAKEKSKGSTGKGLGIVNQIIDMYNKLHTREVNYITEDLLDDKNRSSGTRISINIPL